MSQVLIPMILPTQEVEIWRMVIQGQPMEKVSEISFQPKR
jgi:hypothetical protein